MAASLLEGFGNNSNTIMTQLSVVAAHSPCKQEGEIPYSRSPEGLPKILRPVGLAGHRLLASSRTTAFEQR